MNPIPQLLAIKPKQITLTRTEGPTAECDKPVTVSTFAKADWQLGKWSNSVSRRGGYDKVRFTIEWPETANLGPYSGRYDLEHWERRMPFLEQHVKLHAKWLMENPHYSTEDDRRYAAQLLGVDIPQPTE